MEHNHVTHRNLLTFPSTDPSRARSAALTQRGPGLRREDQKFPQLCHFDESQKQVTAGGRGVGGTSPRLWVCPEALHLRLAHLQSPIRLLLLLNRQRRVSVCPWVGPRGWRCALLNRFPSAPSSRDAVFWRVTWGHQCTWGVCVGGAPGLHASASRTVLSVWDSLPRAFLRSLCPFPSPSLFFPPLPSHFSLTFLFRTAPSKVTHALCAQFC